MRVFGVLLAEAWSPVLLEEGGPRSLATGRQLLSGESAGSCSGSSCSAMQNHQYTAEAATAAAATFVFIPIARQVFSHQKRACLLARARNWPPARHL
jgi:hypothetical protein